MKRIIIALLCLMAWMFPSGTLFAQADRGSINGRITDNTGAIVPIAIVTLRNEETGVAQNTVSNADGIYLFQNLNPGSYTVTITLPGLRRSSARTPSLM